MLRALRRMVPDDIAVIWCCRCNEEEWFFLFCSFVRPLAVLMVRNDLMTEIACSSAVGLEGL